MIKLINLILTGNIVRHPENQLKISSLFTMINMPFIKKN
jgi:hypothetical protein